MRDVLRWIVIGSIFILPFIPLLVTGSLFFSYITGKNFAFRIIVEIAFSAWILLALLDKNYRPRFSWVGAALVAFVAIIFVADLFGANPSKSFWSNFERMEGFVTLVHLLLYFVVIGSTLTTEKLWTWFFNVSLIACCLISLWGFGQLAGWIHIAQGGVRIEARLGNAIYLAAYMLFHTFIALRMLAKSAKTGMRILYGILALVFMFLLVQTATRGAIIGLVGGLLAASLYAAFFSKGNQVVRRIALLGIAVVILASGAFYLARQSAFVQESPIFRRIASISLREGATRFTIWSIALEGIQERPILGWGQGNFDYVFDAHYRSSLYAQEQWFDRVHNIVLDWLIAGGIMGFAGYIAVWASLIYALLRRSRGDFSVAERGLLIGLLAGYGLQNLFGFDNLISYFFFIPILALVHSRTARDIPRLSSFHIDQKILTHIGVPVVGVLLCLSFYYVNVPNIGAAGDIIDALTFVGIAGERPGLTAPAYNTLLMSGLDEFKHAIARNSFANQEIREQIALTTQRIYLDERASKDTKQAYIEFAESELQKQLAADPNSARMHAFLGMFYRTIGNSEKALEQFQIVHTLSPDKQSALFDIGFTLIDRKEYEKAKETFKQAFELAPAYDEARVRYIVSAIYANDTALVSELSAPPYDTLYRGHDLILQTYYNVKKYDIVLLLLNGRIEKTPKDLESRILKATVQHETGDITGAIETITQAIKDIPEFKIEGENALRELRKLIVR